MKLYETTADLWRRGVFIPVGTEIQLAETEAKYLGHALVEKGEATTNVVITRPVEAIAELAARVLERVEASPQIAPVQLLTPIADQADPASDRADGD